jgi:hypothetical protein
MVMLLDRKDVMSVPASPASRQLECHGARLVR